VIAELKVLALVDAGDRGRCRARLPRALLSLAAPRAALLAPPLHTLAPRFS